MPGPGRIAFRLPVDPDGPLSSTADRFAYRNEHAHLCAGFTGGLANVSSHPIRYANRITHFHGHNHLDRHPAAFALDFARSA